MLGIVKRGRHWKLTGVNAETWQPVAGSVHVGGVNRTVSTEGLASDPVGAVDEGVH